MLKIMINSVNKFSFDSAVSYLVSLIFMLIGLVTVLMNLHFGNKLPFMGEWDGLSMNLIWRLLDNTSEEVSKGLFVAIKAVKDNFVIFGIITSGFTYLCLRLNEEQQMGLGMVERIGELVSSWKYWRNFAFLLLNSYSMIKGLSIFSSRFNNKNKHVELLKFIARIMRQPMSILNVVPFCGLLTIFNCNEMVQMIVTPCFTSYFLMAMILFNLKRIKSFADFKSLMTKLAKIWCLIWVASITDTNFYSEDTKKSLVWPLKLIGNNLIVFGDLLPGLFLSYIVFTEFVQKSSIRWLYPAIYSSFCSSMVGVYAYNLLKLYLVYRPNLEDHFMSNLPLVALFFQWNILLRTVY